MKLIIAKLEALHDEIVSKDIDIFVVRDQLDCLADIVLDMARHLAEPGNSAY